MTPYEQVESEFQMPFPLYPPQIGVMNELAPKPAAGYFLEVGTGKTPVSTWSAFYKKRQTLVLVPPILGPMWRRWLLTIPDTTVTLYAGTPKDRAKLKLDTDFIVMSLGLLKNDYDAVVAKLDRKLTIIVDEATSCKNVGTDNFKSVYHLQTTYGAHLMLLTGTPLSTPADAYAYAKFLAPGTYRNLNHFNNLFVKSRDFFGNVEEWQNLELMNKNLAINSSRLLQRDILPFMPPVNISPLYYNLDPQHYRLYKKLADEELLELESGGKIDATSASALYHALGQVVVNYGHFADDPTKVSKSIELVEEILDELGDGKLLVFSNYRFSNALLAEKLAKYNPGVIYGDISATNQQKAILKFIDDPTCRVVVAQSTSAGYGIDGWQHVCNNVLFLELPAIPAHLNQAIARVHRNGQTKPVQVRLAVAEGTLQLRQMKNLVEKDYLVNRVIRNAKDLRDALFGVC